MRYKATLILLLTITVLIFYFQGDDFLFTLFKGGKEYNEGTKLLEKREFSEAADLFEMAIQKNPLFAEAYINLGFAHAQIKQFDQAETDFWTAIELLKNGNQIETKDKTGISHKLSQAYKNLAILVYQEKIKESISKGKPGDVIEFHEQYHECLLMALEADPSQSQLKKYLDLEEKNKSIDIANAHYQLSTIQLENEDLRLAEQNLKEALLAYPYHKESLLSLGILYESFNDTDQAIEYFERALEAANEEIHILNTLAELYSGKKQFEKAIEYYQRSLKSNPNQSGVIYNTAVFYKELNQNQKSIENFQKYLDMEPNAPDQSDVERIISLLKNEQ